jgi:PIN domain
VRSCGPPAPRERFYRPERVQARGGRNDERRPQGRHKTHRTGRTARLLIRPPAKWSSRAVRSRALRRQGRERNLLLAGGSTDPLEFNTSTTYSSYDSRYLPCQLAIWTPSSARSLQCENPRAANAANLARYHKTALAIAEKYGYGIYDALVAAAALEAGCKTLYSEDLRNEQRINCRLTIRNPFR